jgi:hypothetical protein
MKGIALLDGRKLLAKIAENWPAKVISIALAIILFVFHQMRVLEDRVFYTPLHIEGNGNLIPANSYPRMIRVSLRGEKNSIDPIMDEDIETYLDLTKYTEEGIQQVPVQYRKLGTALGVDSLEIKVEPLTVTLELDHRISKSVPLSPNIQGYLEQGYELSSSAITPTQVVVDGPSRIMGGISTLSTEVIEQGGRSEDFTTTVRIINPDPLLVIQGNGLAEFRGLVTKIIIYRNFDSLPITLRGLDPRFTAGFTQRSGGMRLAGPQSELEIYVPQQTVLYLDCGGITEPGTWDLLLQADIPPAFTLVRGEPQTVTVTVWEPSSDTED